MKIVNVVGARPNFMKISPLIDEMRKHPKVTALLVHTGQHYDPSMSKQFFDDLGLPEPDVYLGVGSGTHAEQTAKVMVEFEKILKKERPDLVLVVGDVNSTLACALTASKMGVKVAHVEAGLRSFDRTMPEEINRVLTDHISDYLFTTEEDANENLRREGIGNDKIFLVGDVMIDTLTRNIKKSEKTNILKRLGLKRKEYAILTLHRPATVDSKKDFTAVLDALSEIQKKVKIVFPAHPRTKKMMDELGLNDKIAGMDNLLVIEPLGYLEFLRLVADSKFVLTDSGGIQEETTVLGIPCLTLRANTERPVTISEGTNTLVGLDRDKILEESMKAAAGKGKKGRIPRLWDGKAAERIVNILLEKEGA